MRRLTSHCAADSRLWGSWMLAGLLLGACLGCGGGGAPVELPDFDALWDYQDPAATEQEFRQILSRAEGAGDLAYRLELKTQIARAIGLQGKFTQAHQMLDTVELDLGERPPAELAVARVRYLLERGRVFNSNGHPARARPLFDEVWQAAQALGADYHAVDAAHMLGIVAPPEEQLAWNQRAMARAEQSTDPRARKWLGPLYHNSGMTCLDAGRYEEALDFFEKDWVYRQEAGGERETRIAKWCVAHTLRKMQRIDEALAIQRELEAECAAAGEADGFVFEEIAECLHAQEQVAAAQPYFQQAYEHLREVSWLAQSEPERIARLRRLGSGEQAR